MTECPVCNRPSYDAEGFCKYHTDARVKLREMFESWRNAYGEIDWENYLGLVFEADATGTWVLEVIEFIKTRGGS